MQPSARLALLYALLASLALLLLAPAMPPFQNPDEIAHADRADQISHGALIASRLPDGQVGGMADAGLAIVAARTATMPFHPAVKLTRAMLAPTPWAEPIPTGFPNTAIYPPLFYLPAAAAAFAARHAGLALPQALILMRLATGAATILTTACAIALAGDAAIWLFTIMLLPMSLGLTAAISQDGPMLASLALATALTLHLRTAPPARQRAAFAALCVLLAMAAMARPPYLAFALLLIATPVPAAWRLRGAALIVLATAAWIAIIAVNALAVGVHDAKIDPVRQAIGLATHSWRLPMLAIRTVQAVGPMLADSFIGTLGWLDAPLPVLYYRMAWIALAAAALAVWRRGQGLPDRLTVAAPVLAAAGAAIGLALVEYLTWTPVGAPVIGGLQGRYFLPCAIILGTALVRAPGAGPRGTAWLTAALGAFPAVSIAAALHAVLARYYV